MNMTVYKYSLWLLRINFEWIIIFVWVGTVYIRGPRYRNLKPSELNFLSIRDPLIFKYLK